ncbi:response regulator [Singulisphaera acidiphila]|uniref:histidine kinase n=1 Tax=Singulisphaera acidiphila (strain ATCC BAA-1392 / DSM 18658 / VKM B-2454 / MOB10) TaxID=886293 RepID=L0D6Y8_SINAD|nr:response regulator [Singulisphaera acidiphila]AGA25174.1 signal transduction histidine kinase [Singulisphaera acidiphila DSM 18658]
MSQPLLTLEVLLEPDIILARQRARQIAALLGFPALDQTRIATATSEIARKVFENASGGRVEFLVEEGTPPALLIRIQERSAASKLRRAAATDPLGANPDLGDGTLGARRLMDRFAAGPFTAGGNLVSMAKDLPKRTAGFTADDLARISGELARQAPRTLFEELQEQNQELIRTLQELRERQTEIAELHTQELEETNRGVVALYAELDENAKALKRISDLKSRFLSNMSHEFRSPLNSILSLSGFLLDRSDGELTSEQEKQVRFIRKAAEGLATLVNDLLDLAKVEAGKAVIRPESFEVADLFESLSGMILPLLERSQVVLRVEDATALPTVRTDEGKVAQILRNFLSNAAKFTERGEIRLAATTGPGDTILFSVADSGIGIAPADWKRVFEEFGQIEGPLQAKSKGTGLGLPLSRKLAELLGGAVSVRSEPGVGSTFFAAIPRTYREPAEIELSPEARWRLDPTRRPVLVIEDDAVDLLFSEKILEGSVFQVLPVRTRDEARRVLRRVVPVAILLDILPEEEGWLLLAEIKARDDLKDVPVFVISRSADKEQALALGAAEFHSKPIDPLWLLKSLKRLDQDSALETILLIDDEEPHRYVLKGLLSAQGPYVIIEAFEGQDGIRRARETLPDAIFLDLAMPGITGFEVLERLKGDPLTRDIPVIISTSKILEDEEREWLAAHTVAILAKATGTREEMFVTIREALAQAGLVDLTSASAESRHA